MLLKTRNLFAAAVLLGLAPMSGCGSERDLIAGGHMELEPRIDRTLRRPPEVYEDQGDLVISGRLERGLPRDLGGHMDVSVVAPDGATVYDVELGYQGDTISRPGVPAPRYGTFCRVRTHRYGSYAAYAVRFPGLPPDGSVVYIRHDYQSHAPGTDSP